MRSFFNYSLIAVSHTVTGHLKFCLDILVIHKNDFHFLYFNSVPCGIPSSSGSQCEFCASHLSVKTADIADASAGVKFQIIEQNVTVLKLFFLFFSVIFPIHWVKWGYLSLVLVPCNAIYFLFLQRRSRKISFLNSWEKPTVSATIIMICKVRGSYLQDSGYTIPTRAL